MRPTGCRVSCTLIIAGHVLFGPTTSFVNTRSLSFCFFFFERQCTHAKQRTHNMRHYLAIVWNMFCNPCGSVQSREQSTSFARVCSWRACVLRMLFGCRWRIRMCVFDWCDFCDVDAFPNQVSEQRAWLHYGYCAWYDVARMEKCIAVLAAVTFLCGTFLALRKKAIYIHTILRCFPTVFQLRPFLVRFAILPHMLSYIRTASTVGKNAIFGMCVHVALMQCVILGGTSA